jgi:hypothetical protein
MKGASQIFDKTQKGKILMHKNQNRFVFYMNMSKNNNFVPDYLIKYQAKQPKTAKEPISIDKECTKTNLEIRSSRNTWIIY